MGELKELYMMFTAYEFSFLIPLSSVKSVMGGGEDSGQLPVLDFGFLTGDSAAQERRYQLLLETRGRELILKVDGVEGIQAVAQERITKLPSKVINENNRYLCSAVRMEGEEGAELPAFTVDPDILYEMTEETRGSDGA